MTTRKTAAKTDAEAAETCDNHPERVAAVSTTSGGAHSEIHLCRECARAAGRL
ncbi:hypothetical protein [Streptomyces sp. NPDC004528]|uniref:hypothetical protein n=1 Tax=Streptomyces sp. NPDC004528 TaxID=3154550 RepID=UPI0033A2FBF5